MNLALATTNDLIEELKRRYPLLLMAGTADLTRDDICELLVYHGDLLTLLGATDILHDDLLQQHRDNLEYQGDIP